jgi:hypothetical protein
MLKKNISIYFCKKPSLEKINSLKEYANHTVGRLNGSTVLWPNQVDAETINPKNFIELKEGLGIVTALFIDKIIGTNEIICITDHVNRSGKNFLRSNTPEGELPQFPDMSKIYNELEGFEKAVVHTIGSERLTKLKADDNYIYSELVGLIAPVAHYIGIKVFAIGCKDIDNIIEKL